MSKTVTKLLSSAALAPMTPTERRVGRFLRAPDHDAGTPGAPAAAAPEPAPAADPAPTADLAPAADDDSTALGGAAPADDGVPGEPAPEAVVIPEAYELTAPEGMNLDAELLAEATPVFKEIGLSNEAANKIMPFAGKLVEKTAAAIEAKMVEGAAAQRKAWLDDAKAAEDIGGSKWDATLHTAAKGLDALGYKEGSDFRKLLTETGLGNHPDMIRIAAKLGALVGEDGAFVTADAGAKVDVPLEKRLYPND